jgi:hypothetical protein
MGDRMDKIERVARAMCQARRKNPDGDSGRGPLETVTRRTGLSSSITQERHPRPNWLDYEEDAAVFVAAYEAITAESSK